MRKDKDLEIRRAHDRAARAWRAIGLLSAGVAILVLLGCTTVEVVESYKGASLPKPDRILVYEFSYSLDQVKLHPQVSPGAAPRTASSIDSQKREVGRQVSKVLAHHLVKELRKMGLAAEPGPVTPLPPGNTYTIEGQFLSIDLGDLTERAETGLGRTEVKTRIQLYHHPKSGKRLLETLDGTAKGTGAGSMGTDVEAEAVHTAEQVAEKLREFFAQQGWISLGPTRPGSRSLAHGRRPRSSGAGSGRSMMEATPST